MKNTYSTESLLRNESFQVWVYYLENELVNQ
jgi:hypothetical protein